MYTKILNPKTIVLCGSAKNKDTALAKVHQNLKKNFSGKIYVTKAKGKEGEYLSVGQIVDEIDLAVIKQPATELLQTLRECGEQNITNIIILGTTSSVRAASKSLKQKITAVAARYHLNILGPRSAGFFDTKSGINASIFNFEKTGSLAMISQSIRRSTETLDYLKKANIGISKFFSLGERSCITECELLLFLDQDPDTRAILLCLESFSDAKNFLQVARSVAHRKPVVVFPTGSVRGDKFAESPEFQDLEKLNIFITKTKAEAYETITSLTPLLEKNPLLYRLFCKK